MWICKGDFEMSGKKVKASRKKKSGTWNAEAIRDGLFIVTMFVVVIGCFAAAMTTLQPTLTKRNAIDRVSAFDLQMKDDVEFVETEGRNGIKYYIVTKNQTSTTDASRTDKQGETNVTDAAATTASSTSVKTTRPTSATVSTSETSDTQTTASATTTTKAAQTDRRKVAYLTFDDGPSENTGKILDILDRYNVKATFFVIHHSHMDSKYRAIVERGHTIALHSYTHSYRKIYASEDAYFDDLQKIHDFVQDVTGVDSNIIRFPGGSSNTISNRYCQGIMKDLKKDVLARGYVYHDWNVDSTDAAGNNRSPEVLLNNVKAGLTKRKCNILMHDTGSLKKTTVDALPSIIEYVRSQGYEMEPLTEDSKVIVHSW